MAQSVSGSNSMSMTSQILGVGRRYWDNCEEEALLSALEVLRAEGKKCDGKFKGGYVIRLENMIRSKFPASGLQSKHIKSKLQVWKRSYHAMEQVLNHTGGGPAEFNHTTCKITVINEVAWAELVKENSEIGKLRDKAWPYYPRWKYIFGNDHADGRDAFDLGDAENELVTGSNQADIERPIEEDVYRPVMPVRNASIDIDPVEDIGETQPSGSAMNTRTSSGGKRKRVPDFGKFETMIGSWMSNTSAEIKEACQHTRGQHTDSTSLGQSRSVQLDADSISRRALFDEISQMSGLNLQDQIDAARYLALNKGDMDLFWGMNNEARVEFVKMLLGGYFQSQSRFATHN